LRIGAADFQPEKDFLLPLCGPLGLEEDHPVTRMEAERRMF